MWALDRASQSPEGRARFLVATVLGEEAFGEAVLSELRRRGVACAPGDATAGIAYARAWRYSHYVQASPAGSSFTSIETGSEHSISTSSAREIAETAIALGKRPQSVKSEDT